MNIDFNNLQQQVIEDLNKSNTKRMTRKLHAVYEDAINFVANMSETDIETIFNEKDNEYHAIREICLNGATSFCQWSYNGGGLTSNSDIAKHYCTPSELKKKRNGMASPSKYMTWLDVQANAAVGAMWKIYLAVRNVKVKENLIGIGYDRTSA